MAVDTNSQLATDERVLEDASALEQALEDREKRKKSKNELQKQFKEANDRVKALLGEFALEDGEVARCGRFRITKKASPGRVVSFETSPSSRFQIQLAVPDES